MDFTFNMHKNKMANSMKRAVGIALLPLVINFQSSVSGLSVRFPLHMSRGQSSVPKTSQIESATVLASTATSPFGTYLTCGA